MNRFSRVITRATGSEPWWVTLWWSWGAIIGTVIWYADRNPVASAAWLGMGLLMGAVGMPVLIRFALRLDGAWTNLICGELLMEMDETAIQHRVTGAMLALPLVVAMVLGPLWGGAIGILFHWAWGIPAAQGAQYGMIIGVGFVAVFMSIGVPFATPREFHPPPQEARKWRFLMLLSPILSIPVLVFDLMRRTPHGR